MEFKENLKQMRLQNGLTQAQLAEKLFVSRSTVAKWENGLGLPNPESMAMLETLFDINASELATKEPEKVIVKKNRKLRQIGQIVGWSTIILLVIAMICLPVAIHNGEYGFTPDMAAGSYADRAYIDTGDYRIYYFTFGGDWENGRHWSDLQGFRPVKKHFWGYTVSEDDYAYKVFTKDNYVVGRLYTIKGENGYYNLINKAEIKIPDASISSSKKKIKKCNLHYSTSYHSSPILKYFTGSFVIKKNPSSSSYSTPEIVIAAAVINSLGISQIVCISFSLTV